MKQIVVASDGTGLGRDQKTGGRGQDVGCRFPLKSWTFNAICI